MTDVRLDHLLTRRKLMVTAFGAAAAAALSACGGDDGGSSAAGTTSRAPAPAAGSFPVTVTHVHGTTEIKTAPKRVVTYGYTDQDPALALGVVPVGIIQWIPQWKRGIGPWAEEALGGADPVLFSSSALEFEKVAAATPDLILIVNYDLKKSDYDKLSKIAPTVPTPAGFPAYGTPWDAITTQVGTALGKRAQAEAMVKETQALFAKAKTDHPSFGGKRVIIATPAATGKMFVFSPTDSRGRFVTQMGFTQPADLAKLTGDSFYTELSGERYDLLDGDALIMLIDTPEIGAKLKANKLYQRLDVVKDKRVVNVTDLQVSMALSASSVLSIPYALERIVPELDKVLQA